MRAGVIGCLLAWSLAGCAAQQRPHTERDLEQVAAATVTEVHYFVLRWYGVRVGFAVEKITRSPGSVTLARHEVMQFRRGETPISLTTDVEITANDSLQSRLLRVTQDFGDGRGPLQRVAERNAQRWMVDGVATTIPASAVPSELVPLLVQRDGHFRGDIILGGRGFAVAQGVVAQTGQGHQLAQVIFPNGTFSSVVVDNTGMSAERTQRVDQNFELADVLELGSLRIAGEESTAVFTVLSTQSLETKLPRQLVTRLDERTWQVQLGIEPQQSLLPGPTSLDRASEIAAVAAEVAHDLTPSLAIRDEQRGDCTTYALAVLHRVQAHGLKAHLVTGFVVDGSYLRRHRWTVVWTGTRWISVDATVPPGTVPRFWGLALHGEDAAAMAGVESLFSGISGPAWNQEL